MSEKIVDWAKFGAAYNVVVALAVSVVAVALTGALSGSLALTALVGVFSLAVIGFAALSGALGWSVNYFIYKYFKKHVNKHPVPVQVAALGIVQGIGWNFVSGEPVVSLGMVLANIIGAFILVWIAGLVGLKVPVQKRR